MSADELFGDVVFTLEHICLMSLVGRFVEPHNASVVDELVVTRDGKITSHPEVCVSTGSVVGTGPVEVPAPCVIVIVRSTGVAGSNVALPGWLARTEQVPAAIGFTMFVGTMLQTAGVSEVRITAKPDDEVAVSVAVELSVVTPAFNVNVIVCCDFELMRKSCVTGVAAV